MRLLLVGGAYAGTGYLTARNAAFSDRLQITA